MQRFLTLFILMLLALPVGISISGCSKKNQATFCNGGDSGTKVGQITSIGLGPKTTGISLNFGATGQLGAPNATDCKGSNVGVTNYSYGTTDTKLVDVSPTGSICAGEWNRNSPAGVPDFTTCIPTGKAGTAFLTASAGGATSNIVPIYTHLPVTSVALNGINGCLSQGDTTQLTAQVFNTSNGVTQDITSTAGNLLYTPQDTSIVTINQLGIATARYPGSTVITATVAQATSTAGFFFTCPPASISLSIPGVSGSSVLVNQNNVQPLTASVIDSKGKPITGLDLEFVSTNPSNITVGNTGSVTAQFPGDATITALCVPISCNPAPFQQIGLLGNGKPIVSNPVQIITPGTVSTVLYMASTQSRYFSSVDFTTNTIGKPVLLPFIPNSMVLNQNKTELYFGSSAELMVVNSFTNGLAKEDNNVSGTVLAISPDNGTLVMSDPVRKLIYLYATSNGSYTSFGTVPGSTPTHAEFSPDSQAVYIAGGNTLYVYSDYTGWHVFDQSSTGANDVAVTVPNVGAYIAGTTTTARSYCVRTNPGPVDYYPKADTAAIPTDRLVATNDGKHILGVAASAAPLLSDLAVTVPINACPLDGSAPTFSNTVTTQVLTGINAASIGYIVPATDSSLAFVTYSAPAGASATGTLLPAYKPVPNAPGQLSNVTLAAGATAPVNGVFSSDNQTFFVGTSGDNLVHIINAKTLTDTRQINPNLVDSTGKNVVPDLIVDRPRPTT